MPQTEVIFYVLATGSPAERQDFACKLAEKIYRGGQFCFLMTDNPQQAEQLDQQLWSFRAGSFVPHQRYQGHLPEFSATLLIGGTEIPEAWQKIIVNLSNHFPPVHRGVERIVEILDHSDESRQAGRQRYRHYREQGLAITTHKQQPNGWIEIAASPDA